MLRRLLENPLIRAGLMAAALAFCGLGLAGDWPAVQASLARLHWYAFTGAFVTAAAGAGCMTLAWRAILADLGSRLPVPAAVRIMSVAQLGKYLPGAVWVFAAQVELGRDHQIPRRRGAAATLIALAVALGTGLLLGTIALPIASAGAARRYLWLMALAPVIAICLAPPVLRRLLDRALLLIRRQPLERPPSTVGLVVAAAWTTLGWVLWGTHAWFLVDDLTGRGASALLLGIGGYALAWSAGIVLVMFPGGIGPREVALVAVLAPVMPRGAALVVALMSRVAMTATDLAWAGVGFVISRVSAQAYAPAALSRRPAPGKHRKPAHGWTPRTPGTSVGQVGQIPIEADSQAV